MHELVAPPDDWPSLGLEVAAWIEAYLKHDSGEFTGDPVRLTDEQLRFLVNAYRLYPLGHDREGQRVVRRGVLSRPKGSAKSSLAKMMCCAEGSGPVQFDGWDADKNPVGRPRPSPFVRVMATEEQQSITTVFGGVVEMYRMAKDENPRMFGDVDEGLTRIYLPGGGEMRPSTASSSSKDGGRETFVVVDEGHLWTAAELREAYRTVRRNLAKRPGAWLLECSTMFAPGENSVMEGAWNYARKQMLGHTDYTFLWDHREGPEVDDLWDDEKLMAALREAYGDVTWVPLVEVIAEMRDPEHDLAEMRRYFLNQRVAGDGRCIDPVVLTNATSSALPAGPVALGFDGSYMRAQGDPTALVAVSLQDTRVAWLVDMWEHPPEECFEEVDETVSQFFAEHDVALMYCDRARYGSYVDKWFGQWPKKVKAFPTGSYRRVAWGFRRLNTALGEGNLVYDGDERLTQHITNAVKRKVNIRDDEGNLMWIASKDGRSSLRHIDGYYAMMLGHEAASDAIAAGYRPRRRGTLRTM